MWGETIGCCFRWRPQAEPSEVGLAWVCRFLFELLGGGGYGGMAGRVFAFLHIRRPKRCSGGLGGVALSTIWYGVLHLQHYIWIQVMHGNGTSLYMSP